ncbi:MAG TPA: 4Fe-4S dicluster domain-containing protein [Desulfurivibrio alkaliphilus]|uniref:4Fe-4S dicluster domain-containing protein n=1 Tax=Desulfurivibrio alkaliphilus TaxID=427923 RepID=A0A7C2TLQ0_9BACT|nr:4Fe-4S dicluster domain-containing protein [Desulfurivibrio alkaliphilus]
MKELLILSGKGGTGKTTVTGALAAIVTSKVMADCDVDAADLHLILQPRDSEEHEFWCGVEARIDPQRCTGCGTCFDLCRFKAIEMADKARLLPFACEGCGVCAHFCPEGAINMVDKLSGSWFVSTTDQGPLLHARLGVGEENSGKLVSLVKRKARELAASQGVQWLLVDGPPGLACPAIAALAQVHTALLVTEPTLSGLHDLQRLAELTAHFRVPTAVCLNKWDLHPEQTREITEFCRRQQLPLVGKIPFDRAVVDAIVQGLPLPVHAPNAPATMAIEQMWATLQPYLEQKELRTIN